MNSGTSGVIKNYYHVIPSEHVDMCVVVLMEINDDKHSLGKIVDEISISDKTNLANAKIIEFELKHELQPGKSAKIIIKE